MRTLAVYGKGGIGKSTVFSTLAGQFAAAGQRVLLIGCDPKHDSSYKVAHRSQVRTVMGVLQRLREDEVSRDDILLDSRFPGLKCIETGGPEPGVGCAGRGITRMFEVLEQLGLPGDECDVVMYDVLGDVVCGGFAAPIRSGWAREVFIVASGELMSLYAANNIARAVQNHRRRGSRIGGLIPNLRGVPREEFVLQRFAERLRLNLLPAIPRAREILAAETRARTVVETAPDSEAAVAFRSLFQAILSLDVTALETPAPLDDLGFEQFVAEMWEVVGEERAC